MKRALCIAAILALVTIANADVRAFVTNSSGPAGLQSIVGGLHPGTNAFAPTFATVVANGSFSNAYDYYYHKLSAAPAQNAPSGTLASPIVINPGEFAYIWFQWRAEVASSKVNGLEILIRNEPSGTLAAVTSAYYKQDNRNSFSGSALHRWDGTATPPGYIEWTNNNPQTMVGVDGQGIRADTATPAQNWDMYTWQAGGTKTDPLVTGVSLLGALTVDPGLYSIHINKVNYSAGENPVYSSVGYFQFIPEPASLLLMGLAGLLLRRR